MSSPDKARVLAIKSSKHWLTCRHDQRPCCIKTYGVVQCRIVWSRVRRRVSVTQWGTPNRAM